MDYANLHGRAARLDCVALDTANKVYNLEIQQENEGALPKRPRYHASLLDANILEPGTEFQNLPYTTVIFITKNDVLACAQHNGMGFSFVPHKVSILSPSIILDQSLPICYR